MSQNEIKHNFADRASWFVAINKAPDESWIESRSLGAGRSSSYIPIPVKQALADIFFNEIDVVGEEYKQIENEILCVVKLQVLPSYPDADYRIITGVGAKPIAAKSGSRVEKFPAGKITNSLEYCAPNARVSAIANALETFGNIFGRNLGRAVSANFSFLDKKKKKDKKKKNK